MANKVKYNLKNVHAAKLTRTEDGGYSYETPRAIPGAVSISLDAEGDTSPFYADGIVYFRSVSNNGYSGDLEIALIPEWFRTDILKDAKCIRHVMYNCTASRPSIESETKEDTIEPGTEKLSLTADPREDGLVKSRTGDTTTDATYNDWYKAVYVPVEKTASASSVSTGGK